jgi:hypothetical protein
MRALPIVAVAALALTTAAASAQMSTSPNSPGRPAPATAVAQDRRLPVPNPLSQEVISNISGTAIYGGDDSKLGHVSTVLMEPSSKKIDRLVVSTGGVLGIGGHRVAIPVDQFSWDSDRGAFRLSTTLAAVKSMPEWVEGQQTMTGSSRPPTGAVPPDNAGDSNSTSR